MPSRAHLQVIYLVPMLIKFSDDAYNPSAVPVSYGTMTICLQCRDQLGKGARPSFSMGGSFKCDFGYPEFLDGLGGQTPTPAELLCLAKTRPYVQIVKARQDHSPGEPNRGMTGHIITFLHDSLASRKQASESYPRKDLPSHLSIVLLGSDAGAVPTRDRIKKGLLAKGPIALRPPLVNALAHGLHLHNALYAKDVIQDLTDSDVDDIISKIALLADPSERTMKLDRRVTADVAQVRNPVASDQESGSVADEGEEALLQRQQFAPDAILDAAFIHRTGPSGGNSDGNDEVGDGAEPPRAVAQVLKNALSLFGQGDDEDVTAAAPPHLGRGGKVKGQGHGASS